MHPAAINPSLDFDVKIHGSNCDCCCNPGDRLVYHPPVGNDLEGKFVLVKKKCCNFSCCIFINWKSKAQKEEDERAWKAFTRALEAKFGTSETRFALRVRNICEEQFRSRPLTLDVFNDILTFAKEVSESKPHVEEALRTARFVKSFKEEDRSLDIASTPDVNEESPRVISSQDLYERAKNLTVRDSQGNKQPFDAKLMHQRIKDKPIVRSSDGVRLQDSDVERISLAVIEDLLSQGNQEVDAESIRKRVIRYLKIADFDVKLSGYWESDLGARVLNVANRAMRFDDLTVQEFYWFEKLARAQIAERITRDRSHSISSLPSLDRMTPFYGEPIRPLEEFGQRDVHTEPVNFGTASLEEVTVESLSAAGTGVIAIGASDQSK